MPDREKVIKELTVRIQSDSDEGWNTIELPIEQAEDILALLKERGQKRVCPNCNGQPKWVICGLCGQAVEWNG